MVAFRARVGALAVVLALPIAGCASGPFSSGSADQAVVQAEPVGRAGAATNIVHADLLSRTTKYQCVPKSKKPGATAGVVSCELEYEGLRSWDAKDQEYWSQSICNAIGENATVFLKKGSFEPWSETHSNGNRAAIPSCSYNREQVYASGSRKNASSLNRVGCPLLV